MTYNYEATVHPVKFKDYLPTPLKLLTPLTAKRQLVQDIQNSATYLDSFPVLEKLDDFDELWSNFYTKVSLAVPTLSVQQYGDFISNWNLFHTQIASLTFTANTITTVPRAVIAMWPLDFSFIELDYKDKRLLEYFDAILTPSTNNMWQDLFDSTEHIFDQYVTPYINSLGNLREIKADNRDGSVTDAEVLNLTAKMEGLNLRDELLNAIGPQRLAAIIPMLGQFYEINCTDDFVKIIELIISSRVLLEHLFTKDYINFVTQDKVDGSYIYEESPDNRLWFKTTHINLYVEYNGVKYLADAITAPLGSSVMDIINLYMPLNLVVKRFGFFIKLDTVETAPSIYFSGAVTAVNGNKTIKSDTRYLAPLIPFKTVSPYTGFMFKRKWNYSNIVTGSRMPNDYSSANDGALIWTPSGNLGWVGVMFDAPSNLIHIKACADDSFYGYHNDVLVIDGNFNDWQNVTLSVTKGQTIYLSFNIVNPSGTKGFSCLITDAVTGDVIKKSDATWISG